MIVSKAYSLEGFDWKTFILGFKKPFVVAAGFGLTYLAGLHPALAGISGLCAERIWAVLEFYIKQIKA